MTRIRTLFLLLTIIGPLHMGEQMLTRIDEFHSIRDLTARHYYALFEPASADVASVLLITIVWTIVSLLIFALLHEGTPRLLVLGFFGLFGVQEIHHVIESIAKGAYDPGLITCIPYAVAGGLLVSAVAGELRGRRRVEVAERSFA